MIAVVTSTLIVNNAYSFFSDAERLEQTLNTIVKLDKAGFSQIFLFDNSLQKVDEHLIKSASEKLRIYHSP